MHSVYTVHSVYSVQHREVVYSIQYVLYTVYSSAIHVGAISPTYLLIVFASKIKLILFSLE